MHDHHCHPVLWALYLCNIPYLLGVKVCPGEDVGDIGVGVVPEMALGAAVPTQSGSPFLLSLMINLGESEEGAKASFSDRGRAAETQIGLSQ